jgi:hypothetical protein
VHYSRIVNLEGIRMRHRVKESLQQIRGQRSVTHFAEDLGFSKQYDSNVLCGNKKPSDLLLRGAGIQKKVTINYEVFPGPCQRRRQ